MLSFACAGSFGDFTLDAAGEFPAEGITALFGVSGCGKTSLLRALAGFERCRGHVRLGEQTWQDDGLNEFLAPHERPVGFVFQDDRLFSHLDVLGNLEFAAKRAGATQAERTDVINAFQLRPLLARDTSALSGGERRRVAIARTMLAKPRLVLLDEPLSGLDRERKAPIYDYIEALPARFGVTVVLVTHVMEEVAQLADHLAVMDGGRIRAIGSAGELMEDIDLQTTAGRYEAGAVLRAEVIEHDEQDWLTRMLVGGHEITMPLISHQDVGRSVRLFVRARDVAVATQPPSHISIRNVLRGSVVRIVETSGSAFVELVIDVEGQHLRARITRAARRQLALDENSDVFALVKSVSFDGPDG